MKECYLTEIKLSRTLTFFRPCSTLSSPKSKTSTHFFVFKEKTPPFHLYLDGPEQVDVKDTGGGVGGAGEGFLTCIGASSLIINRATTTATTSFGVSNG